MEYGGQNVFICSLRVFYLAPASQSTVLGITHKFYYRDKTGIGRHISTGVEILKKKRILLRF